MVLPFLLTIHMDEKLMSSTTNDWEKENASQTPKMFKHNPVRFVFAIGMLHILVSIALSLYALYLYIVHGHVSTLILVVLMIWLVGASVIISLGYIGKDISKHIYRVFDKDGHL